MLLGDREALVGHLARHERGETNYEEMSTGVTGGGVERWTVDTQAMTMTFATRSGDALLVEVIR